ncbi:MAG: leucyl aminopeptidase family protein [Armatimonadetes bacterium]|nr:leucyl aminopeptidase family protein [Armatimonadota bacterium]
MFLSVAHRQPVVVEAVVVPWFSDDDVPVTWPNELQEAVRRKEFTGDIGQVLDVSPLGSPRTFLVSLGRRAGMTGNQPLRKAMAAVARRLSAARIEGVVFDIVEEDGDVGMAAGEALGLLSWRMAAYKGSGTADKGLVALDAWCSEDTPNRALVKGLALAESANLARSLVATPPNIATPAWMADQARSLESEGVKVDVWEGQRLEDERMAGLINVGKASENKPRFVRMEYRPTGATGKPVVLIGKTITYDTGGLAIKTRDGMKGMKGDKAGGCAVVGAMHWVATQLMPAFPVVGILVAAENSISDNAFRMDDVITYRNGVTVEVTNTDAEGRLVLADGLAWACEREDPACIVDLATLTGGVVIALGKVFAGLFANDEALARQLDEAGKRSGERVWRLPLDTEYNEILNSEVADIVNSAASKGAHPVMGATFLTNFVAPGVPWAHLDIAGTSGSDADKGLFVVGPTGFGVRLLAEFLSGRPVE